MTEDDDLLKSYHTIWDKVSADIKKEFDSESVYNKIFLKTKIKFYDDKVTNFYNKTIPMVGCNDTWLPVINLEFALKRHENYYPQCF